MKELELLAPAGDWECFIAAVENGADVVYMGLKDFNARVMANNFDIDEYINAINYAHVRNVKVYLTLNTLLTDSEVETAVKSAIKLYSHGLDGIIVHDIGLASVLRSVIPNIPLHASTQMTIHSLAQVKQLEKLGFSRVVLARELTIDEIKNICSNTNLEVEVFVHGALCVGYSGQCLLSQTIGDRSGNRGNCAQPCRMTYDLYCNDKCIEKEKYLLSKKDIYGLPYLKQLADAGVKSFKIEGRNRGPAYVAMTISKYRKYLDLCSLDGSYNIDKLDEKELEQIFNRSGLHSGYLNGKDGKESISYLSPKNTGLKLGKVISKVGICIKVELLEDIDMHDGIEVGDYSTVVTCIKDSTGKIRNCKMEKGNIVLIGDIKGNVNIGDEVYKTSSKELNMLLKHTWEGKYIKRNNIDAKVTIKKDEKILLEVSNDKYTVKVESDKIVLDAQNRPTDIDVFDTQLRKTKDTPFEFNNIQIDMDDNIFVPISEINEIRRRVLKELESRYILNLDTQYCYKILDEIILKKEKMKLGNKVKKEDSVYLFEYIKDYDYSKLKQKRIYIEIADYIKNRDDILKNIDKEIYLVIPNIVKENLKKLIENNLDKVLNDNVKGIVIGNIGYFDIFKKYKEKYDLNIVADYTLNIYNSYSAKYYIEKYMCDSITLLKDVGLEIIEKLSNKFNVEVITEGYINAMSSEYCIVGSFCGGLGNSKKCTMPCVQNKYYLIDRKGSKIYIECNNIDCNMNLIKKINYNKEKAEEIEKLNIGKRYNLI